jgi:hypothetical protein
VKIAVHGGAVGRQEGGNGAAAADGKPGATGLCQNWIVAQEGSRETYAVPVAFQRIGRLKRLYVDIWCRWCRPMLRRGPPAARALATRFHAEIPCDRVVSFTAGATLRRAVQNLRGRSFSRAGLSDLFCSYGRWFALRIRRHLRAAENAAAGDCFLGFNSNCLEALEALRSRGILTVVDQVDPGRVEEDLVLEEAERWPGWEGIPGRMSSGYWDRLKAEWDAADLVLVNSDWSAEALARQGVPRAKLIVVPLCVDLSHAPSHQPVNPNGDLKVLWLGSLVLRKGIQYLVEAARRLQSESIQFLLAGPLGISERAIQAFPSNIKLLGRVTRDRLGDVYRRAHVFVLPTISDGFGITQLEAMAHGLPVVATPNCGRVVTDGADGFIVPARDGEALAEALARLNANRKLVREMSQNALLKAARFDLPSSARMIQQQVLDYRRRLGR